MNECIVEKDKFTSIANLIEEYYCLVNQNNDGLPPYATFKTYLVDNDKCCINRPKKIKELVDKLNSANNDDEKLHALSQLWVQGDIEVDEKTYNGSDPMLIHSATQKGKLQSAVKEITKENLLKISKLLYGYVMTINKVELKNELFFNEDNMKYFKNKFNAVLNELLFWFHYDKDQYPLINSRAENSRKILNRVFSSGDKKISNDLEFNQICTEVLKDYKKIEYTQDTNKTDEDKIYISKQLLLDQLFYSIDEMKSMKKVEDTYSNEKDNEIYKFYKKLWNTIKEAKRVMSREKLNIFKNIIYHGAPGTGKTYELKQEIKEYLNMFGVDEKENMEFVQFHGAYGYEDFIGGLKPDNSSDNLKLKFTNGIFKELCRKAAKYELAYYTSNDWKNDSEKIITFTIDDTEYKINKENPDFSEFPPYFILIDEINRADLSRVFGELLYAIEDDYRGFDNKFKLSTSSMEDKNSAVCCENNEAYFFVPKNIYIRGTMNDIDKSVDSIDFAFRRRFKWINKKFDKNKIEEILLSKKFGGISNLDEYQKSCEELNDKILKDISIADESYKIGHAIFANIFKYFEKNRITKEAKEQLFDNHIEPIIYNYLKMDYGNEESDTKKFRESFVGKLSAYKLS